MFFYFRKLLSNNYDSIIDTIREEIDSSNYKIFDSVVSSNFITMKITRNKASKGQFEKCQVRISYSDIVLYKKPRKIIVIGDQSICDFFIYILNDFFDKDDSYGLYPILVNYFSEKICLIRSLTFSGVTSLDIPLRSLVINFETNNSGMNYLRKFGQVPSIIEGEIFVNKSLFSLTIDLDNFFIIVQSKSYKINDLENLTDDLINLIEEAK